LVIEKSTTVITKAIQIVSQNNAFLGGKTVILRKYKYPPAKTEEAM